MILYYNEVKEKRITHMQVHTQTHTHKCHKSQSIISSEKIETIYY